MPSSPPKPVKEKPKPKSVATAPIIEITAPEEDEVVEKPKKPKESKAASSFKTTSSSTPKSRVRKVRTTVRSHE